MHARREKGHVSVFLPLLEAANKRAKGNAGSADTTLQPVSASWLDAGRASAYG